MVNVLPFNFLTKIFPQPLAIDHQIMVCSQIRASGRTLTDWCADQDQAGRQIEKFRRTRGIFFGVALQNRAKALRLAHRQTLYRLRISSAVTNCNPST